MTSVVTPEQFKHVKPRVYVRVGFRGLQSEIFYVLSSSYSRKQREYRKHMRRMDGKNLSNDVWTLFARERVWESRSFDDITIEHGDENHGGVAVEMSSFEVVRYRNMLGSKKTASVGSQAEQDKMWAKGYRYMLQPPSSSKNQDPLYVKTRAQVDRMVREDYPNESGYRGVKLTDPKNRRVSRLAELRSMRAFFKVTPRMYALMRPKTRVRIDYQGNIGSGIATFQVGRTTYSKKYRVYSKHMRRVGDDGALGGSRWTLFARESVSGKGSNIFDSISLAQGNMAVVIKSFEIVR